MRVRRADELRGEDLALARLGAAEDVGRLGLAIAGTRGVLWVALLA